MAFGGDSNYPLLWYDGRFGQNYMAIYDRFARMAADPGAFRDSRNSRTDIAPQKPGGSRDAIISDHINSNGYAGLPDQFYQDTHMSPRSVGLEAVDLRRENNVGYADGHVETHDQPGYIDSDGYLTWEGAGGVWWGGIWRNAYWTRCRGGRAPARLSPRKTASALSEQELQQLAFAGCRRPRICT